MHGTLIFIRHGRSKWNQENRFTGWVDVPLAPEGWREAEQAGELLKDVAFDVAYTSHLQRAILTLHLVLRPNISGKSPIFLPANGSVPRQSYIPQENEFPVFVYETAISERHYGDLQGKNKDEIREEFGEEQFKKWRRGYDTPPPNGESLQDTLWRSIPFFRREILPHLEKGETVLVSAHGNSLRAMTKYLENISDADILGLEIPTGVPIVYTLDVSGGEVKVLDKKILVLPEKGSAWK